MRTALAEKPAADMVMLRVSVSVAQLSACGVLQSAACASAVRDPAAAAAAAVRAEQSRRSGDDVRRRIDTPPVAAARMTMSAVSVAHTTSECVAE